MEENPLAVGERVRAIPPPTAMVVFGGSGDLAHRKIVPALYNLELHRLLPQNFAFVGSSRSEYSDEEYRADMRKAVEEFSRTQPIQHQVWESFASRLHYVSGSSADPDTYARIGDLLDRFDRELGTDGNRMYYLSLIPKLFPDTIRGIGKAGLGGRGWDRGHSRVVVEKPFGHDLTSARELQELVTTVFPERDVFRIDHYLGKESVQNIIAFRFANGIFEPVWNHHFVDHVQVTVSESLGIEHRGNFYETAGAIRDIFQNHELQVLALIAMEPPASFEPEDVRNEKAKVLKALRRLEGEAVDAGVVRAQYGPGWIAGKEVPGYRDEPDVHPDSTVETYVAAELRVDNWRWAGTPFYVRTGKRLPKRATEVVVQFKSAPHLPFGEAAQDGLEPNALVLRIQPDEGITMRIGAKVPGPSMEVRSVSMDFSYGTSFSDDLPDAYERLLLDVMLGDPTLFPRWDEVEQAWQAVQPILDRWAEAPPPQFPNYEAGSWGPKAADELIARGRPGRRWRRP
ncbi:MAG TPA: glucose-6-phosphate dehydrogenase [Actinomycetes bacterium]|jgi:glucose-6-phosphate 1-dehydrogenase|nr:glucose-6-phosphate dehydrogenase [Actinomycetes bacterium]HEX5879282.1 glucose-6-phosphate dehydrogenase [Actinomycetota bacterium]